VSSGRAELAAVGFWLWLAAGAGAARAERTKEFLVPPGGGSYEIQVYPHLITMLDFAEPLASGESTLDPREYETVRRKDDSAIGVSPRRLDAGTATLSLASASGAIRVTIILRVAKSEAEAQTFVHFRPADQEAALESRIQAEVARRTAALEGKVRAAEAALDAELLRRADEVVAARALAHRELVRLRAVERNDDNVIVYAEEMLLLGDQVYLFFAIENRGREVYRVGSVQVLADGRNRAGLARMTSSAAQAATTGAIGVVAPGRDAHGVVVLRRTDDLRGVPLTLAVAQPSRRGGIAVDRIVVP
jgi:hypothetical protein